MNACSLAVVLALAGLPGLLSQEVPAAPPKADPKKGHEILKAWAGTWDTLDRYRPAPDAPYSESNGLHTIKLEFGGTWLVSDMQTTLGGIPYRAHLQIGYDLEKKRYIGTIICNLNPRLQLLDGTYDEATKTLTLNYEGLGASGKPEAQKSTWEQKGDTGATLKIWFKTEDGKEFVGIEKSYKKR